MPYLLSGIEDEVAKKAAIDKWGDWFLAPFLLGGTAGGLLFGSVIAIVAVHNDRHHLDLLGLCWPHYFATELWQVATLRFVAMGVGGEWAWQQPGGRGVPKHARTHASGFFMLQCVRYLDGCDHRESLWARSGAGVFDWRHPGVLVVWCAKVKEPEGWKDAKKNKNEQAGSYLVYSATLRWRKRIDSAWL